MTSTKPAIERIELLNPNYDRFYEFVSKLNDACLNCPSFKKEGNWSTVLERVCGVPVHTNWPLASKNAISVVYVCESPSNREFSHGLPSVGTTGQQIYKQIFKSNLEPGWLEKLDRTTYRTNLVRCQADSGLQKRINDSWKNNRVEEAAPWCFNHLEAEITQISQRPRLKKIMFVIAIGKRFAYWSDKVEELIRNTFRGSSVEHLILKGSHPTGRRFIKKRAAGR